MRGNRFSQTAIARAVVGSRGLVVVGVALIASACGGGAPAATTPSPVAPTAAVSASPQRPSLASPVPSPAPASNSPAAKPSASTDAPGTQTYTVEAGDTLLAIAEKFYGDSTKWRRIYDANKDVISDPDALKIGMQLKIPPKE